MNCNKLLIGGIAIQSVAIPLYSQVENPNIIIIMTDQQRADICGREGFPMPVTPYVDSLAKENIWFNRAYTVMPASSPARCSMFTGRFPNATHVRTNHNVADVCYETDMIAVLKENHYQTALIGKNHAYLRPSDFDFWSEYSHWGKSKPQTEVEKKVAKFLGKAVGQYLEPSPIPAEEQQPSQIIDQAIDWVTQHKEQPFFTWISFPEPHNPYQICEPYYSMFAPDKLPKQSTSRKDLLKKGEKYQILAALEDASCPDLSKDLQRLRGNYMGMIRLIDDQIKRFMDHLAEQGLLDKTIVVILSDHGDYCGEYGLIRKGAGLCESLIRIPMVWAGYGIKKHSTPMEAFVSLADIFPTLCSAIGAPIPKGVQGRSLWPMLTGEHYPKDEFSSIVVQLGFGGEDVPLDESLSFEQEGAIDTSKIAGFDELNTWTQSGTSRAVRMGNYKLIMDSYGNGELYDLKKDPYELNNVYGKKEYIEWQNKLMERLLSWELRLQDPLPLPRRRYHFKQNPYNYHFAQ